MGHFVSNKKLLPLEANVKDFKHVPLQSNLQVLLTLGGMGGVYAMFLHQYSERWNRCVGKTFTSEKLLIPVSRDPRLSSGGTRVGNV